MLNSTGAQRISESYESARLPQLAKEQGSGPYLRAPKILRLLSNPCNLRVMPRPKGSGGDCLPDTSELKNDLSPMTVTDRLSRSKFFYRFHEREFE
jgi:hypothetical protein